MSRSFVLGRDVLLRMLSVCFFIGAPTLLYLDNVIYPGHFFEHLPDHLLALIAIAAGMVAIYYERKLDKSFDQQKKELSISFSQQRSRIEDIVESVHTRYIGDWPDHIVEITDLVKDTRSGEDLLIFVDVIGYAHYTRRELYKRYLDELQSARRRDVKIRILLHPEAALRKNLDAQFEKEKTDPQAAKALAHDYQAAYKNLIKMTTLETYPDFVAACLYVQARFCDSLLDATYANSAEIASAKQPEDVYYWAVRQGEKLRNMVFTYSRFTGVGQGYGFRTADPRLIAIFCRDFDRKWKDAHILREGKDMAPQAWKEAEGEPKPRGRGA